jgi:hypothetical protein
MPPNPISMLQQRFTCVRLSHPYMTQSSPRLFHDVAESARGVSPRASHRSGRDTLVSSGSCHRAKAAAFRREFELLPLPVGSLPTSVTCPLRSTSITPASSLVRGSPPLSGASVLSASRVHRLCFLPWHRRPGSQVPFESPNESHASYTPDTAWPVGRSPPYSS